MFGNFALKNLKQFIGNLKSRKNYSYFISLTTYINFEKIYSKSVIRITKDYWKKEARKNKDIIVWKYSNKLIALYNSKILQMFIKNHIRKITGKIKNFREKRSFTELPGIIIFLTLMNSRGNF